MPLDPQLISTPYWHTAAARTALRTLNAAVLELLFAQAALPPSAALAFQLPEPARRALRLASSAQRQGAAHAPILLCDLHFAEEPWWQAAIDPTYRGTGIARGRAHPSSKALLSLHRAVLHYAWHLAEQDPVGARFVLGLTEPVRALLLRWGPLEIERMAERTVGALRPRWLERPAMWIALLEDPQDVKATRIARIRTLQGLGWRSPAPAV